MMHTMSMFHWPRAECLKNYSSGDIIVMAPTVELARDRARVYAQDFLKDYRSWWYDFDGKLYDDDKEDHQAWLNKFEADIAAEPDEKIVIFISGSE